MVLYLDATTSACDLMIDFIEVRLKTGETVSLNWDYSGIERSATGFGAKYSGVYFDEEYANGQLEELQDLAISAVQLYSESVMQADFAITSMEFVDGDQSLFIPKTVLAEQYEIYFEQA